MGGALYVLMAGTLGSGGMYLMLWGVVPYFLVDGTLFYGEWYIKFWLEVALVMLGYLICFGGS